ncbi:hypothetical protein L210DRAFT_3656731 [Boletus edulis BED1]|uniref:Uncharacterized protein n=1 Tax=Boletus edulis BED1 TaxID=1328754 RepID=A0AAD4G602_BOLED|nr:hypothetical protein L210DRAFT_3656731 [Boletus edulis BED1]
MFRDIAISPERINALPEDDIPIEISVAIRHEDDDQTAMKEQAGYVPTDDLEREEDVQETDERENFVAGKGDDNLPGDGTSDDEDSQVSSEQDKDGSVIPLQYLGVSDTELNEVSMDERMKYALANQQDSEGGYIVRHGVKPLSEFGTGRGDRTAPTENPLAAAYPVLFPYGIGGIEAKRERKIPDTPFFPICHLRYRAKKGSLAVSAYPDEPERFRAGCAGYSVPDS